MFYKLLLIILVFFSMQVESSSKLNECEARWNEISAKSESPANTKSNWMNIEQECKDTGLYYHYLSLINVLEKKYDTAHENIQKGLNNYTDSNEYLLIDEADLLMHKAIFVKNANKQELYEKSDKLFKKLLAKYPNSFVGMSQYASLKLVRNQNAMAVELAEKSIEIMPNLVGLRTLAIAAQRIGESEKTLEAAKKIVAANRLEQFLGDAEFMLSVALAYNRTGAPDTAFGTLKTLLSNNEDVKHDPAVKEVFEEIKKTYLQQKSNTHIDSHN
ncbi:hypothetical protein [Paraferrimonas sp. SM1919]|uniref:hypothetical protein n=1 Tax=Paraferrimonas sp. SM1919 TaxID=2662263 RepID=UPI0013D46856|nr:hypothetical protein [Paraferrimonas sp. SM1919]